MDYICSDCPRSCHALRGENVSGGFCASPSLPVIARAAPHFGEEPCISGTKGSGTVFFSGCNLGCVFCQNHEISRGGSFGKTVSIEKLREIFLRLRDSGVHNINLVTPTHFTRAIAKALDGLELGIPVVWNSSGYEKVETLRMLDGLVQIYMPDFKYADSEPARRYCAAIDYPQVAFEAISEMYRQTGAYKMSEDGLLCSGVLIRHLIMPDNELNSMQVIDKISDSFPEGGILFSLMSQFTPMPETEQFPELQKTVDAVTAKHLYKYMLACGLTEGYWQDTLSATGEMIPEFDGSGV